MFESNRILAVDVGASKVALAEFSASKTGGLVLLNYGIVSFGVKAEGESDASAYVVAGIREIMHERGIKPAPLLMTLSGQSVFPRFVKLPPVTQDKLLQMIQYEAEQNVPFPINEVVWDYQLIGGDEGELNVMLVAVKAENVKQVTDCVLAAGMEPEVVDVAPMALYNAVRYNYPDLDGCTMLLDIGARSSNLIFIEGNRIFSRSIPVAGNAITQELAKEFEISFADAEELKLTQAFVAFGGVYAGPESEVADRISKIVRNVVTRLHAEVNRSINFYRSQQGGSAPTLVLLTGGSSVIPHTDTFFREKLKVDVEYLNPFINVAVGGDLDPEKVGSEMQILGEVVGLALRKALTCPVEVNLMPDVLIRKKAFRRRLPFFAMTAVGLVLVLLCWWTYTFKMRGMLDKQLQTTRDRIRALETRQANSTSVRNDRNKEMEKVKRLLSVVERRTYWLEVISALHAAMPDGMWLKSLEPKIEGNQVVAVTISGMGFEDKMSAFEERIKAEGKKGSAGEAFCERLRKSPCFVDSTATFVVTEPPSLGSWREFTVRAALKKPIEIR